VIGTDGIDLTDLALVPGTTSLWGAGLTVQKSAGNPAAWANGSDLSVLAAR
jgi:hypothetical protein